MVPAQATNVSYFQHEKAFINYVTNHNISSVNIPEPGLPIKYVIRLSIEGYFPTFQKNKVVSETTINKVVSALVNMCSWMKFGCTLCTEERTQNRHHQKTTENTHTHQTPTFKSRKIRRRSENRRLFLDIKFP